MALKNNYENLKTLEDDWYYRCEGNNTVQLMACADLERPGHVDKIRTLLPDAVPLVYSDPPWNPGNRKYWRTKADEDHEGDYDSFLDVWCGLVGECIDQRGTKHIFTEQSFGDEYRQLFLDAVERCESWTLPLSDQFKVFYGSPGSRSRQRPNMLLHFAETPLTTDPSGLDGEPMTIRACAGVDVSEGSYVFDPCIGKGMTSRMALYNQWNCVGTEINAKRLGKAITWLERHDFDIEARKL